MSYNLAIHAASEYLKSGNKKLALEAFKNSVSGDKIKIGDLENAASLGPSVASRSTLEPAFRERFY